MSTLSMRRLPLLLLAAGMVLTALVYWPGLSGGWLVDDETNLGAFTRFAPGEAPYRELVFGNQSGPLGRSVSMLSFAASHALGLFSTTALKAGNLALHLAAGLLLFALAARLLRLRPPGGVALPPALLAAVVATWWWLLPLQTSTVLYIVQRMTLMASVLSLACCLAYVIGREALQAGRQRGWAGIGLALLVLLPLALLAKESALATLPWLVLIEVFFFRHDSRGIRSPRAVLGLLVLLVVAGMTLALLFPPEGLARGYLTTRDFTMGERLLSQPRALWAYIGSIFVPDGASMGLFHDDFAVSRAWHSPATTLPAIAGLALLAGIALWLANSARAWLVSFGIFFFLAGHLVESTIVPLEMYFEHRNYLPAAGLLLALLPLAGTRRLRPALLAAAIGLYLAVLAGATWQRSHVWGDKHLLLAVSAINHPHSLRAWSDYAEDLLARRRPAEALQAIQQAADRNPHFDGISYLHMLTVICRLNAAPPPAAIQATATRIGSYGPPHLTPLSIGLDALLEFHRAGHCRGADFSPLVPGLLAQERHLQRTLGDYRHDAWLPRFNIARWLLETGHTSEARDILRDIWRHFDRSASPPVGLALARALDGPAHAAERRRVLDELEAVSSDAPPDFRKEMQQLRQSATGAP